MDNDERGVGKELFGRGGVVVGLALAAFPLVGGFQELFPVLHSRQRRARSRCAVRATVRGARAVAASGAALRVPSFG